MKHIDIKNILIDDSYIDKELVICGWIKTIRKTKQYFFIELSDGTSMQNLQIIVDKSDENLAKVLENVTTGTTIKATGKIVKSNTYKQNIEMVLHNVELLGTCSNDYPLQKKKQNLETLRELPHLRSRTNTISAVLKVRSTIMRAIHEYMEQLNFTYVNTPIITRSNCEGAGEMFQVTTEDLNKIAKNGKVDYTKEFFGKPVGLTVSGQFEGEAFAQAFSKIYTFGPTFRADPSHTPLHIAEFWQVEPEVAFCDLEGIMDISEEMMKYVIKYTLERCEDEFIFLDKFVEKGLLQKLNKVVESDFKRVTYKECIDLLKQASVKFEFKPEYGEDLAKEHERYITEYFKCPVFITYWPQKVKKCFYMKQMDDGTVANADLEMPGIGETYGMSQREDDFDKLERRIEELGMDKEEYRWYMNLRKYGTTTHSGFGMGFERLIMYMTGMTNIRDVSAFPRTPNNCLY